MNLLISLLVIMVGIYFLYSTYKKPAPLVSTDMKGYIAGVAFIIIGFMSLIGKFDLLLVFKQIFNAIINK